MIDLSTSRQPTGHIARSLPDEDHYHAIAASLHQTGKDLQEDPSTGGSESLRVGLYIPGACFISYHIISYQKFTVRPLLRESRLVLAGYPSMLSVNFAVTKS